MDLITTIVAFFATLGILIVIHELGHYWAARRCNVKVLRFSVGFGRPLWSTVRGPDRTEWVVAAIPLGGYVRMLDERDHDDGPIATADLPRAFNRQSVWRRIFIVLAGPAANLLLAVLVYWVMAMVGTIEPQPLLGTPAAESAAARAGIRGGDIVQSFAQSEVRSWNELRWNVLQAAVSRGDFELRVVDGSGAVRHLTLSIRSDDVLDIEGDVVTRLGFSLNMESIRVYGLAVNAPAERAGIKLGDEIVSVDGEKVVDSLQVRQRVMAKPAAALDIEVLRDGHRQSFMVTTDAIAGADGRRIGRLGVEFFPTTIVRDGPVDALARAAARTWGTAIFSFRMLGRMIVGEASWKNLSGPVTIADYAGQTARIGVVAFLSFLALVSISLGVLNLLPIPMLDGGHLLYYAVEIIRGSPPAQWLIEWGQRAGIAVLVMLTALALYNDLTRLLS